MKLFASFRRRMMLLFCTAVGLLLLVSYLIIYWVFTQTIRNNYDGHLLEAAASLGQALATNLASPGDLAEVGVPGDFFEIRDDRGRLIAHSRELSNRPLNVSIDWSSREAVAPKTIQAPEYGPVRVVSVPVRAKHGNWILILATSTKDADRALRDFQRLIVVLLISNLGLVAVGSSLYVRGSLRPLSDLTRKISAMTRQFRSRSASQVQLPERLRMPLPVLNPEDELGRLTQEFNQLFATLSDVLQQMQQFVSDASHELRTPLSILRGETSLLLRGSRSTEEYQQALAIIDWELKNLARIVEGLFTLAMADAGRLCIAREPVNIHAVLNEACELVGRRARARSIAIDRQCFEELSLNSDEVLIRELFLIFLDNALKYSPPNTTVRVSVKELDGVAVVTFEDQGFGIAPEHLPHIFERFYRVALPGEADPQSGGLGLAIARAIAEAHEGSVECSSTPGKGSIFTIKLPSPFKFSPEEIRQTF
jgi:two-component system OmpR family sensor kinase